MPKPPDDPLFKHQWHLRQIQIPHAWGVSHGAGATVAVLDTGVAYEHRGRYERAPDLAGTRFVRGWDFVDGDPHANDEPPPTRQSHGTHIAGIIAQTTGNGVGGAGVAPEAAIMPVRVLKPDLSGSPAAIASGLRYAADHGADVANLSIAGLRDVRVVRDAVGYASAKGVTVVAAAGNDGKGRLSFPAAYPAVVSVGALSRDRALAYYSNHGRGLDLVAPAGDLQVVDGGGGLAGDGVLQQTLKGGRTRFCYCFMASTSAAAAQVSGAVALLVASARAKRPSAIRAALRSGAEDLGPRGRDPQFGAGLVQASDALAVARAPSRESPASADSRSAGWPDYAWLALALVAAGVATRLGLSLLKRRFAAEER